MANHRWQQQQQQPHEQQLKALTKLRSQHDQSEKEGERKGKTEVWGNENGLRLSMTLMAMSGECQRAQPNELMCEGIQVRSATAFCERC